MPGSSTTQDRICARVDAHPRFAFRCDNGVSVPIDSFAAQWLAYMHPCRRFAPGLTADDARLGADVVRYYFIVVDLQRASGSRSEGTAFEAAGVDFTVENGGAA